MLLWSSLGADPPFDLDRDWIVLHVDSELGSSEVLAGVVVISLQVLGSSKIFTKAESKY